MEKELTFRLATKDDLQEIVRMLSDDTLGSTREKFSDNLLENYARAFEIINADQNQELTVAEMNGEIVATFHLTFIQYLTHQGGLRAQIEAVRTNSKFRGQGIGRKVFDYAINRAKNKGCFLVQLTTDKQRPDAIRFYETIGFVATHEGMKLKLAL
jgi:ribosomal protein S18 acetylase RimI-like enzyme